MALTVLVTIYVMTLKQIEAESLIHPAVAIAILSVHLATFMAHILQGHCHQESATIVVVPIKLSEATTAEFQIQNQKQQQQGRPSTTSCVRTLLVQ